MFCWNFYLPCYTSLAEWYEQILKLLFVLPLALFSFPIIADSIISFRGQVERISLALVGTCCCLQDPHVYQAVTPYTLNETGTLVTF